jgi:hypothetical protein
MQWGNFVNDEQLLRNIYDSAQNGGHPASYIPAIQTAFTFLPVFIRYYAGPQVEPEAWLHLLFALATLGFAVVEGVAAYFLSGGGLVGILVSL